MQASAVFVKIWKILTFFLIHLKPKAYHGKTGVAKKKLGTDTTGARIADGKVYYATYPEGGTHKSHSEFVQNRDFLKTFMVLQKL